MKRLTSAAAPTTRFPRPFEREYFMNPPFRPMSRHVSVCRVDCRSPLLARRMPPGLDRKHSIDAAFLWGEANARRQNRQLCWFAAISPTQMSNNRLSVKISQDPARQSCLSQPRSRQQCRRRRQRRAPAYWLESVLRKNEPTRASAPAVGLHSQLGGPVGSRPPAQPHPSAAPRPRTSVRRLASRRTRGRS